MSLNPEKYWLLKAEPDSRIVKGKDVKFSVDDFETVGTSPWEGVRNYEARNLMKEMKEGDKALFYHSNCKVPGIAAFAKVSKEAYPDYTAWDASHPYYDPKTQETSPKWFMVDLTFTARAKNFVPLSLLRRIADSQPSNIPEEVAYIGSEGINAIKCMDLVTRGRLSVQRVQKGAWKTIVQLSDHGGWKEPEPGTKNAKRLKAEVGEPNDKPTTRKITWKNQVKLPQEQDSEDEEQDILNHPKRKANKRKREAEISDNGAPGLRRSTRVRK